MSKLWFYGMVFYLIVGFVLQSFSLVEIIKNPDDYNFRQRIVVMSFALMFTWLPLLIIGITVDKYVN